MLIIASEPQGKDKKSFHGEEESTSHEYSGNKNADNWLHILMLFSFINNLWKIYLSGF